MWMKPHEKINLLLLLAIVTTSTVAFIAPSYYRISVMIVFAFCCLNVLYIGYRTYRMNDMREYTEGTFFAVGFWWIVSLLILPESPGQMRLWAIISILSFLILSYGKAPDLWGRKNSKPPTS